MNDTNQRSSGVLCHISSLPGGYGCGSFGDEALRFADLLSDCGFTRWQTLPFGMPDCFGSPYKSPSAFSINPFFIDLPSLCRDGLLTKAELKACEELTPYSLELDRLLATRMGVLSLAASRADAALLSLIDAYISARPRIAEYCAFAARSTALPGCADTELLYRFCEYEFFTQWQKIRTYARKKGVSIIGDIPIYVDDGSSDALLHPELFALDASGRPTEVAGVPPDLFSEDGQYWGNPLYNWDKMALDGFSWWRERIEFCFSFFDVLRIDHFRAIEAYWSIPATSTASRDGCWKKGPGMPFVHAVRAVAGNGEIIAEDLGVATPGITAFMEECGLPGMRLMQFADYGKSTDNTHLPFNWTRKCVAYTGTHDNNTLLGWAYEISPEERRSFFDFCGYAGDSIPEGCKAAIRTLFTSVADTVILPIQDMLLYGRDTRMNTPGVARGNWRFRLGPGAIDSVDSDSWNRLNRLAGRLRG